MDKSKKKNVLKIVIMSLAVFYWFYLLTAITPNLIELGKQYATANADRYGSDTPEKTWEHFLERVSADDLDNAIKYIIPQNRAAQLEFLKKLKMDDRLTAYIQDVKNIQRSDSKYEKFFDGEIDYHYTRTEKDGRINKGGRIIFIYDRYAKMWKIYAF